MLHQWLCKISSVIREKFRFSTLNFLFIIAYTTIFGMIFGPENSIVGVIFTIMMSASMVRDLTAEPARHLIIQSTVLIWMAVGAYCVHAFPAPWSVFINFITLLLILYAFTYEYSSHIYFPYILSYLFLVFISPVSAHQLPKRMLGMFAGAVSVILYQWFMGRKRVVETARDELSEMIDDICGWIAWRLGEKEQAPDLSDFRGKLCRLSQSVYDRRKRILCVSDASFSMIDAGRALEHLLILLQKLPEDLSGQGQLSLCNIAAQLQVFRAFLQQEAASLPPLTYAGLFADSGKKTSEEFENALSYIRDRLLHMTDPQRRTRYRKTALSLKVRLQAALDVSSVRVVYAVRVALLLSCATLLVQTLALPHGKWLLFTLASVSLPYADDVPVKIKKRLLATLMGGAVSVVIYSLVPSSAGRTAAMMLSGYLSFYFTDYMETFACSTVGALGGAVFVDAVGWQAVGGMFAVRLGYILLGVAAAYLINCLIFPYSRAKATRKLWEKYRTVTAMLSKVSQDDQADTQLYYHLVIQAHLQEEKLSQNADLEAWEEFPKLLAQCREQVRRAHRKPKAQVGKAPAFADTHSS